MAVASLRFRMEADNSNALRGIADVRRAASDLGADLQRSIGDKLKGVFSVAVIEEVVRRTGEWASGLAKASQELGVSVEQMQALQVAAERSGIATDKIFTYYNKIEAAALKAAGGNTKLQASFRSLGIGMGDIRGPNRKGTAELFDKAMTGSSGATGQQALLSIFGSRDILGINAIKREMGGKSMDQYAKAHESQIVPGDSVKNMAKAWTSILEDSKSIALKLAPIATIVLSIVDGVLKMVNGVAGMFKSLFTANMDERAIRGGTMARSIANFIPQTGAGLFNLGATLLGSKKRKDWKFVQSGKEAYGNAISDEAMREAEGAGEAAATLATFGTAPIARGIQRGTAGVSDVAGTLGAETLAGKAAGMTSKIGDMGREGILGKISGKLEESIRNKVGDIQISKMDKYAQSLGYEDQLEMLGAADLDSVASTGFGRRIPTPSEIDKLNSMGSGKLANFAMEGYGYAGVGRLTSGAMMAGTLASAGGIGQQDIGASDLFNEVKNIPDRRGILSKLGQGEHGGGGGSGNLAFGGVFGVDIQSKILHLNEKTVDLLQQIVENTEPFNQYGMSYEETTGSP